MQLQLFCLFNTIWMNLNCACRLFLLLLLPMQPLPLLLEYWSKTALFLLSNTLHTFVNDLRMWRLLNEFFLQLFRAQILPAAGISVRFPCFICFSPRTANGRHIFAPLLWRSCELAAEILWTECNALCVAYNFKVTQNLFSIENLRRSNVVHRISAAGTRQCY